MPPRLLLSMRPFTTPLLSSSSLPRFLLPCFRQPLRIRHASILGSLSDNSSAYKKKIRRGRGPSSGKGKTSGRGHKGQKQHGKVPRGFEGGQTPIAIVHGTRGFKNVFSTDFTAVNLSNLQSWIDQGRIDPTRPITLKDLCQSNLVGRIEDGVKLLARGSDALRQPITIIVSRASASAIAAVEKAGGTVVTRFYTKWAIRRILQGKTDPLNSLRGEKILPQLEEEEEDEDEEDGNEEAEDEDEKSTAYADRPSQTTKPTHTLPAQLPALPTLFQHRLPDPTSRKDFEYYRDPAHRGYLSHTVGEGQTPSLFFKAPKVGTKLSATKKKQGVAVGENRIW